MGSSGITLLGLGPGGADLLTRQAWQVLESCDEIYALTRRHPALAELPAHIEVRSFDSLYESGESFESVHAHIVEQVLALGQRPQGVVFALPGHPFIAQATTPEITRRARQMGLPLRLVEGLSFLEPTFSALGLDPFPHTALVDALELAEAHVPPFPPSVPALVVQLTSPSVMAEVKLTLMANYPDEHPVQLIYAAGTPQEQVESLALYEIDRRPASGALTSLYVPALGPAASFEAFQEVIAHLRAPDGCPWDREQTHQSLRASLLEEAYEALAALDADDPDEMREEFGDLLLLVVMHAQIAAEAGEFNMAQVLHGVHTKIVSRHPHVFGDVEIKDTQGVLQNWERLKAQERVANGSKKTSLLDGIALALPALVQAQQYQSRAARVGFDWPDIQGVLDKLEEELLEVHAAVTDDERSDEIGDLLFAVVNLARWHKIDAESALRETSARFRRRFNYIERASEKQRRQTADLSLEEMEALWQEAKRSTEGLKD